MTPNPDDKVLLEAPELLPVPLTRDELLERGQQLAQVESDVAAHNEYAESVKKDLKSKEAALAAERSRLANIVRTKRENRQVGVTHMARWQRNIVEVTRNDTGELLRSRAIEPHERQKMLDLDKKDDVEGGDEPH
jgi:hypothetical protein